MREDVLRELELLPVWKLRVPLTSEIQPEVKTTVNTETQAEVKKEILPVAAEPSAYVCTISDDKKWAFIWPESLILSTSQSTLFNSSLATLSHSSTYQH
jgi:DNA polymerase